MASQSLSATPHPDSNLKVAGGFLFGVALTLVGVVLYQGRVTRPLEPAAPTLRLDLSSAPREELVQLPRVGPALANRIVESRAEGKPVVGIGPKTSEKLKPWVKLSDQNDSAETTSEFIDPNQATLDQLQTLPGIGPKLAQRIIDERSKRPFHSVEDLRRVGGIGPKTIEKLRPYLQF